MAQTKMIARIASDQRHQAARAAGAKPGPTNQRRRRKRQRIQVINIEERIMTYG